MRTEAREEISWYHYYQRCGIENKAQNGTKSDQSDGTPDLLAKPRVCATSRRTEQMAPLCTATKLIGLASVKWPQLPGMKEPPITFRTGLKAPESNSQICFDLSSREGNSPHPTTPKVMSFMTIEFNIYNIQLRLSACRFLYENSHHILTS